VRVAREPLAWDDLAAEVVELRFAEPPFDERPRVDPGRGVPLEEDLVPRGAVVLAAEEVVEADLVEACRGGVGREVPTDAFVVVVRAHHHGDRVPADEPADPELHRLVAREVRLLLGRDRVDVARLGERGETDVQHACPLQQLVEDEARPVGARLFDERIQRLDPLLRLVGIDIRELMLELVEDVMHVAHPPEMLAAQIDSTAWKSARAVADSDRGDLVPRGDRPTRAGRLRPQVPAHRNHAPTAGGSARATGGRPALARSFDRAPRA